MIIGKEMIDSKKQVLIKAFTGNQGEADQLSTKVFAKIEGTSKTNNGYMLEVEDYGSIDPSQVVRFKN